MLWCLCCASSAALLSLLVFVCVEVLGFPVKCLGTGWPLEGVVHGILTCNCYGCYFGCPNPVITLAPCGPFWQLGTLWGTMGAAERTCGGAERDFNRFWDGFGIHF